jgi:hypothetical protein
MAGGFRAARPAIMPGKMPKNVSLLKPEFDVPCGFRAD